MTNGVSLRYKDKGYKFFCLRKLVAVVVTYAVASAVFVPSAFNKYWYLFTPVPTSVEISLTLIVCTVAYAPVLPPCITGAVGPVLSFIINSIVSVLA